METELISNGAETALGIWELFAGVITLAVGWIGTKLSGWVSTKTKSERLGGVFARSIMFAKTAVISVNETMKVEILKAKDPKSPGGVKITKDEGKTLFDAAMGKIKGYWGKKGIKEALKIAGLDMAGFESFLGDQIEIAVAAEKKNGSANP